MLDTLSTALITGASGGIGEAFARQLAALGKDLILVARSEEKLHSLARELAAAHGVQAHVIVADLAQPGSAAALHADVQGPGLDVDLLVNNAGYARAGAFAELTLEEQADMVRLNVNTLLELSRLYLPAMRERGRGGIINVASNAAFQPVPYLAVYAATKAFVLSFSEALAEEVAADGVRVMALCPGATATGFQKRAGAWEDQRDSMPSPDTVVAEGLRAFERGRYYFIQGGVNKLTALVAHLGPRRLVLRMAARVVSSHR